MDAKALDIVGTLREEGRARVASVARRTGLSESAVRNRLSNVQDSGRRRIGAMTMRGVCGTVHRRRGAIIGGPP